MATKTEERIKGILKEFYDEKQQQIDQKMISISAGVFIWGFCAGVVFSYSSLLAVTIGFMIGFMVSKKNIPIFNYFLLKGIGYIEEGKKIIFYQNNMNN